MPALLHQTQGSLKEAQVPLIEHDSMQAMIGLDQLKNARLVPYPGPPLAHGPRFNGYNLVLPSDWDRAPGAPFLFSLQHHDIVPVQGHNEAEEDLGKHITAHCYQVTIQERPDGTSFDPHISLLHSYALDKPSTGYRHLTNGTFEWLATGRVGFVVVEIPIPDNGPPTKTWISLCSLGTGQEEEEGLRGTTSTLRVARAACSDASLFELGVCLTSGRLAYVATVPNTYMRNDGDNGEEQTECVVHDFLWDE